MFFVDKISNRLSTRKHYSHDSEEIRTLASGENGALNHRLRPLGHTTLIELLKSRKYTSHRTYYFVISLAILTRKYAVKLLSLT